MRKLTALLTVVLFMFSGAVLAVAIEPRPVKRDYNYYINLDPSQYEEELKLWYKRWMKEELNLEEPKTFNEKIQWLKLYDSTPIKTMLADKYLVREWVKEKIGEEYLVPLLGVWDKFDDIDFDKLPDKFVLKCNHGSGWNMVVTDKSNFNKDEAKKKFNTWMNKNFAFCAGFELHYKNIEPKIIAEEYLETQGLGLMEYKFMCINGVSELTWVIKDRFGGCDRKVFDRDWNFIPLKVNQRNDDNSFNKPENLDAIIKIVEDIGRDFSLVRVDWYRLPDGHWKFGELTFTPDSGMTVFPEPNAENRAKYGEMLTLPKKFDFKQIA